MRILKLLLIALVGLNSHTNIYGSKTTINNLASEDTLTLLNECESIRTMTVYAMTPGGGGFANNYFILEDVDDLTIIGACIPEDLVVIWRSCYLGSLTVLNMRDTELYRKFINENDEQEIVREPVVPDFSLFHPGEQIDAESMSVTPIKLQKLVSSALQTTIGKYAFAYATNLEEVEFPIWGEPLMDPPHASYLQYIDDGAFIGCVKLPKIELSPGVLEIGAFAFKDCTSLAEVSLPESLTKIGDKCFKNCSSIATIYCLAPEPPECSPISEERGEGTFAGVPADAEIFVPVGSKELYENAPGWSYFTNIKEYDTTSQVTVTATELDGSKPCEVFNLSGVRVGTSTDGLGAGFYLVRRGEKVTKIAVK